MGLGAILSNSLAPLCWPFWEDCFRYRWLSPGAVDGLLWLYLVLAILAGILFVKKQTVTWAWGLFLFLSALKIFFLFQDFQLRLNQHYMVGFASLAFLFFPGKREVLKILIALFYFFSGTLKLNWEWVSGSALYKPILFFSGKLLVAACTYVVILELILIWGIFASRAWIFWATFFQLILFHVVSWQVVGFFYPTVMLCLLAIYPLSRLIPSEKMDPTIWKARLRALPRSSWVFLGGFSLLQLWPAFIPGDSSVTGEGRIFGVHMFDARLECEAYAVLKRGPGETKKIDLKSSMATRIQCDPLVYFDRAKALCRLRQPHQGFTDFDLFLNSKKQTEAELRPVIAIENFCATDPDYKIWRHNPWIKP